MENKPKLMINRNILLSEKSPPPAKLLINHGKPNFTIVKSPKILSPAPKEENIFSGTDLKPSSLRKKTPPKTINSNDNINGSESSDEFLRLHKKIGGKNFDDIENNNSNTNGIHENVFESIAVVKNSPQVDLHFATIQTNGILTLKHPNEINGHTEITNNNDSITNGYTSHSPTPEKSSTPEKLEALRVNSNQSSRTPSPLPKSSSSTNQSMESLSSNSGVNFEQRTVVSFSRDLSVTPNRYPDTVKTAKTVQSEGGINALPKEFADLKFEIASNGDLVRSVVKKNAA